MQMSLIKSLQLNRRVVFALFMRELRTRFGEYHLGYAWLILEPLTHVAILSLLFSTIRQKNFYGIDAPLFVVLGIVPFLLYRRSLNQAMDAIRANRGLFDHRQVRPFDTVFARSVLEILIHVLVYALFIAGCAWLGYSVPEPEILEVAIALFLLSAFTFNVALLSAVLVTLYRETRKIIRVSQRPMYFISGVFFTIEMIPQDARVYLLWNPILHALDLIKGASIPAYESPASWGYLVGFTLVSGVLAMMVYRASLPRLLRA